MPLVQMIPKVDKFGTSFPANFTPLAWWGMWVPVAMWYCYGQAQKAPWTFFNYVLHLISPLARKWQETSSEVKRNFKEELSLFTSRAWVCFGGTPTTTAVSPQQFTCCPVPLNGVYFPQLIKPGMKGMEQVAAGSTRLIQQGMFWFEIGKRRISEIESLPKRNLLPRCLKAILARL